MSHPIVHVEFQVKDAQKASKWYGDVFGWNTQYMENMNYAMFTTGDGQVAGGFNPPGQGGGLTGTIVYIDADDIPAMLKKVESLGGKIIMNEDAIPGFGSMGLCADPDGNLIGLYKGNPG